MAKYEWFLAPAKSGQWEHGDTPPWSGSRRLGRKSYKKEDEDEYEDEDDPEDDDEDEDEDEDEDGPEEDEEAEGAGQVVRWL